MPTDIELQQLATDAIRDPTTRVTRHCDIYESDGHTPWALGVPVTDASVSVDSTRLERRVLDLRLRDADGTFRSYPDGFWYDKVLKTYRGVELSGADNWERQTGEFYIDSISEDSFPKISAVAARDYTARLSADKFPAATSFAEGQPVENVIGTIATNGGVTKFNLDVTGKTLGADMFFDPQTDRWKAITDIATAFSQDVFFDHAGFLTLQPFSDPLTSAPIFDFHTGSGGTIAKFTKQTSNTRLYNHIVVTGGSADAPTVVAEAENNEPTSPSRIERIGRRTFFYASSFITTEEQAQEVALNFLAIHALEEYEVTLEALVIPWLEPGKIVTFQDPDPAPSDPTRYLLSSTTVPHSLGTGQAILKRVTMVGS